MSLLILTFSCKDSKFIFNEKELQSNFIKLGLVDATKKLPSSKFFSFVTFFFESDKSKKVG